MTVATALVSGNDPLPELAEAAVEQALASAGLTRANGVLLFLTPEFARHTQQTVTAVARAAQCTQVTGGMASGVFTEWAWALDRPAAALMVFGDGLALGHGAGHGAGHPGDDAPVLSYSGGIFPPEWSASGERFGGVFSGSFAGHSSSAEPVVWQHSRLVSEQRCSVQVLGAKIDVAVSSGFQLLGPAQRVERSNGYDLERLGGQAAAKSLVRVLPVELREQPIPQLHQLSALLIDDDRSEASAQSALALGRYRCLPIIAANADHSLTLAERVAPGQRLAWAIRQPLGAEADMRQTLARLAETVRTPVAAVVFSCIGRGPYFYGGEDRDLNVLCQHFPGLPVLGIYGTGQIAATRGEPPDNRAMQNAVVTALISPIDSPHLEESDVQPIP